MKRIRFGDIVEFKTSKGLAYAIYTHRHDKPPRFGAMIRVFDNVYQSRPERIEEVVDVPVRFTTFFPLQNAVNRGVATVVGHVAIPDALKAFPIFRSGTADPKTKRVDRWWLWDGEKEWEVGEITAEQRRLPIRSVWNDTFLIHRIEDGWRPETGTHGG